MSLQGQRLQPGRYAIVPRTLSFLLRSEEVLLLRMAADRGAWAGQLNGIGGHVEQGEDPATAALREIHEETGVVPSALRLCGVVTVDTGSRPGIGLYVFVGSAGSAEPRGGPEGEPEWIALESLHRVPLVEDLPILLPRALAAYSGQPPFSAVYTYAEDGKLEVHFGK